MSQMLKSRCNFTLRWLLDLRNTSLEQNLSLKTLAYLLFIPAIFSFAIWLSHGQLLAIIEETVLLIQC